MAAKGRVEVGAVIELNIIQKGILHVDPSQHPFTEPNIIVIYVVCVLFLQASRHNRMSTVFIKL